MDVQRLIDMPIFESDDEEDEQQYRRPKRILQRVDYFDVCDENEFLKRFRLRKNTCLALLDKIRDCISSATDRNQAIPPRIKLLLTLRFYATGTMLIAVGDFVGVSTTAACIITNEVTIAIGKLRPQYINMPRGAEILAVKKDFYNIASFPHVIGALDCTHVRIQSPGGDQPEYFRNRKGYFSLNVQTVCDSKLKIRDVVARWPGSTHDQTIFNNSALKRKLVDNVFDHSLIVGDSGYGIQNYLMTPLNNPLSRAENLFNESQIRTRNVVERSYGVWKRRFPILSNGIKVSLERSQRIIVATAILRNIAIESNDGDPAEPEYVDDEINDIIAEEVEEVAIEVDRAQNRQRRVLVETHFTNLQQ